MTQPNYAVMAHQSQNPATLAQDTRSVLVPPRYDQNSWPNVSTTPAPQQSYPAVNVGSLRAQGGLRMSARSFSPQGRVAPPLDKSTSRKECTRVPPAGVVSSGALAPSLPEAARAAACGPRSAPTESTIASLEQRVEKLEKAMGHSFRTAAQELASSTVSLCVASERRCAQLVEALRDDLITGGILGGGAPELASAAVPRCAQRNPRDGSGEAAPLPVAQQEGQQAAIDSIIDRVLERVKQDGFLLKISAQYQLTKNALEELNSKISSGELDRPGADAVRSRSKSTNADAVDLHSIVKSTASDLRRLRQQRNSDFSEMVARLENLEKGLLSVRHTEESHVMSVSSGSTDGGRANEAHQGTLDDATPELTSVNPAS